MVTIGGGAESVTPVNVTIDLIGPGEVKAFDGRAVTRHWPRRDVFEVEPNYFPLLELFPADVAWALHAREGERTRQAPPVAWIDRTAR